MVLLLIFDLLAVALLVAMAYSYQRAASRAGWPSEPRSRPDRLPLPAAPITHVAYAIVGTAEVDVESILEPVLAGADYGNAAFFRFAPHRLVINVDEVLAKDFEAALRRSLVAAHYRSTGPNAFVGASGSGVLVRRRDEPWSPDVNTVSQMLWLESTLPPDSDLTPS